MSRSFAPLRMTAGPLPSAFFRLTARPPVRLPRPGDIDNLDRWCESLTLSSCRLDLSHDIHPSHHSPEGSEALAIRVSLPTEVQLRLITNADEEIRGGRVGAVPRHGDRAVPVGKPRFRGSLQPDRGEILRPEGVETALDDFDPYRVFGLIVGPDGPVKPPAAVETLVDIAKKVTGRRRCSHSVHFHFHAAERSLDHDARKILRCAPSANADSRQDAYQLPGGDSDHSRH